MYLNKLVNGQFLNSGDTNYLNYMQYDRGLKKEGRIVCWNRKGFREELKYQLCLSDESGKMFIKGLG